MSKNRSKKRKSKKKKVPSYQCPTYKGENKTIREYRDMGLFRYPHTCRCKVVKNENYIVLRDAETGRVLVPCAVVGSIKNPDPYMSECGDLFWNAVDSAKEDDVILFNTFRIPDIDYGPVGETTAFLQDVFSMAIWHKVKDKSYVRIISTMLLIKAFPVLSWDKVINKSEEKEGKNNEL